MRASLLMMTLLLMLALGLSGCDGLQQSEPVVRFVTVEVIITATRDANATPLVLIVTATPNPNEIAALPTGLFPEVGQPLATNPNSTPAPRRAEAVDGTPQGTALPEGCILHTLESGQSPALLAEIYEVSVDRILEVNGLDEEASQFLQIGQQLIVPLVGCPIEGAVPTAEGEATAEGEEGGATVLDVTTTATLEATPTPSLTPTITLAPTATNAQVIIEQVFGAGDVTSEAVVIRNTGRTVDITNWTLRDLDGNVYTFAEQRLFDGATIEVFTRVGTDSPVRKFWGRTESVWGELGDVVTLLDADGQVQAILRLSETALP